MIWKVHKSSFLLLQFLIVEERERDDDDDYDDDDDDDPDPGVYETWKFIKANWNMDKPKLIISVIYDFENSFMNRRLLKSVLADLVKAAATVEGKQSCKCCIMLKTSSNTTAGWFQGQVQVQ